MKVAVAILTCDRRQFARFDAPPENYLDRMLASLLGSGYLQQREPGDELAIFDAGPRWLDWAAHAGTLLHTIAERWRDEIGHVWHGPIRSRLGLMRQHFRAFSWLLAVKADYGIVLPDDCICCKNWFIETRRWLADPSVPKDGCFYGLAARYPWTRDAGNLARRWAPYPTEDLYYSIGATPTECLEWYMHSLLHQTHQEWDVGADWIWRDIANGRGMPIYAHCPDLFADIGKQSTISHVDMGGPHQVMFPGEDYDALGNDGSGFVGWEADWVRFQAQAASTQAAG